MSRALLGFLAGVVLGGLLGYFVGQAFFGPAGTIGSTIAGAVAFGYLGGVWSGLYKAKVGRGDPEASEAGDPATRTS